MAGKPPYEQKAQDKVGTFLRAVKKRAPEEAKSGAGAMSLLAILKQTGPLPVHQLVEKSALALTALTKALDTLRQADLVEMRQQDAGEVVALTERGLLVAGVEE